MHCSDEHFNAIVPPCWEVSAIVSAEKTLPLPPSFSAPEMRRSGEGWSRLQGHTPALSLGQLLRMSMLQIQPTNQPAKTTKETTKQPNKQPAKRPKKQPNNQINNQPAKQNNKLKNIYAPQSWALPAHGLNCKLFQTLPHPSNQAHPAWDKNNKNCPFHPVKVTQAEIRNPVENCQQNKYATKFLFYEPNSNQWFKRRGFLKFWNSHYSTAFALTQGEAWPLKAPHPCQDLQQGGTECWAHP